LRDEREEFGAQQDDDDPLQCVFLAGSTDSPIRWALNRL
jgi:hypothetical protein